jgi:hypothetical protein
MYKVLFIDVNIHTIIYTVKNLLTKETLKIEVSKYEIKKELNIKQNDIITFSTLYLKNLNVYDGKNLKLLKIKNKSQKKYL